MRITSKSLARLCLGLLSAATLTSSARAEQPANTLTRAETVAGWKLLFEGGNSGLMFHVTEDNPAPWQSGPEVQIQDNVDGHDPQKAGWLYQMFQPYPMRWAGETEIPDATRGPGEWNQLFLRISPRGCEVSMNGVVYYQFKLGDKRWDELVEKSKFSKFPGFGKAGEGYICLQDHGNLVSFRNIKIRELADDGAISPPVDGKLKLKPTLAFPKLKWENWIPVDEDGTVNRPRRTLELTYAPGDSKRLYVLDQGGTIYTFENDPNVELAKVFLDIEDRVSKWNSPGGNEQGLLGLAMHPKFQENGQFFVCYTKPKTHESVISRFKVSAGDKLKADPNSEEVLMVVPQPYQNHNGGAIEFGNDGYLYIAFGDGGARNDPKANGQNRSQLLGSILRIDVDQKSENAAYKVPADNPFVGVEGVRPEIYAYGFRNPWRIAFDRKTGKLWCADVGQDLWEEVNVVSKGGNYGWSVREGAYTFGNRTPEADSANAIDPVWAYDHSVGKSITGGRVYRSDRLKELEGKYLYADYVSGGVWALTLEDGAREAIRNEEVVAGGLPVLAFGQDAQGEVYVMIDSGKGESILKLVQDN